MKQVGIVIIGRNEGERLLRCIDSVVGFGCPVVYVDSGSGDDSVAHATTAGVQVVELDGRGPLGAGRARNAGFDRLLEMCPALDFVQFIDGDCELVGSWLKQALRAIQRRPDVAVMCGRRRERHPDASIYNRLCDAEWNAPAGEVASCGGDALVRVAAFRQVGGFNPTVRAGEEPELCQRLRRSGWKIVRLALDMTWHDAAMLRFGQWWRRQVRGGNGALDVALRFDVANFRAQVRSARRWAVMWPAGVAAAATAAGLACSVWVAALVLVVGVAVPVLQVMRLASRRLRLAERPATAVAYGLFMLLGKVPQVWGQLLFCHQRLRGGDRSLIEYKPTR